MSTAFTQAFDYETLIVPVLNSAIDLAEVTGAGIGAAEFIDNTTVLASDSAVSETFGPYTLTVGIGALALDGTDDPLKIIGLKGCSLNTDTSFDEVLTYESENAGFSQGVPTSKSWSMDLNGVSTFGDAGYKVMRLIEKNAVSQGLAAKFARRGPVGSNETIFGYGRFSSFSESNDAGGVVEWSCTFEGYGLYGLKLHVPV